MLNCVFSRATFRFLRGARDAPVSFSPATEASIQLDRPNWPDHRSELWDGVTGIRTATAQELVDYDTALRDLDKQREFDGAKMLKAVAIWAAKKLNIPLAQARSEIMAEYDNL